MLSSAATLVRPGAMLVYSVCTLTARETIEVDDHVRDTLREFEPMAPPDAPWEPWGRGAVLLPQIAGTDGMALFRYRRT
jgi:16S rRNA (cytosine967-C5)-methyltransferase